MIYTFAVIPAGASIEDGIRDLVRFADWNGVGVEAEAGGVRIYAHPGDCAESLIETWRLVTEQNGAVVSTAVTRKVAQ